MFGADYTYIYILLTINCYHATFKKNLKRGLFFLTWNPLPCEVQYYHYHVHEVIELEKGVMPHEPATSKTLKRSLTKNGARPA